MPFWRRILYGILALIFLIWGLVGLIPLIPGGIICFSISIYFFKKAHIPFVSEFIGRMTRRFSIWFENQPWGIRIRKRIADFIKFLRSKANKRKNDN